VVRNHRPDQRQRTEIEDARPAEGRESGVGEKALDVVSRPHVPSGDGAESTQPSDREVVDQHEAAVRS
jgi:hypothetical protein